MTRPSPRTTGGSVTFVALDESAVVVMEDALDDPLSPVADVIEDGDPVAVDVSPL